MRISRVLTGPFLLLAASAFLCGCIAETIEIARPLIDGEHGAEVLTESRVLSNPRSVRQNRLLRGWRLLPDPGGPQLLPIGDECVIELTNLSQRSRVLDLEFAEHPRDSTVVVQTSGRVLGTFLLSEHVEIPLPDALPLGRAVVTLGFSDPSRTRLARVAVMPTVRAGAAEITDQLISQTGWSTVEVTRRVGPDARFAVDFLPPDAPESDQRFVITVEGHPDDRREAFTWSARREAGESGPRSVEIDLGPEAGFVRLLLEARGRGPAGRWENPRIIENRLAIQAPPPLDPGEPPRLVILYVMDALRADHVGRPGLTPVLDGLASEGVRFTNHFAVAPNTPPSTRALFSGLCMLDERRLPHPGPQRLAEAFHAAGYRTASVTGNPHLGPEFDLGVGFEFVEFIPLEENHHPNAMPTVNNNAEVLHRAALRLIRALPPGERGFLYIHTMNPHNPYTPPPEIEARVAPPGLSTIDGRTRTLVAVRDLDRAADEHDRHRLRQLYAAGVAYNDRELGRFMAALDDLIDPREVLLIATSDHGEELFEHGGVLHGHTLYDELLRIPLIAHWPERIRPRVVAASTTTLDVHASLLELAGGAPEDSTGSSLCSELVGSARALPPERLVFAAAPGIEGATMVRSARRKLILAPRNGARRGQGFRLGRSHDVEYVFDLESDPGERINMAGTADLETAWLRTRLLGWTRVQQSLQPNPGERTMSETTRGQLEALGYVVD